MRGKQWPTSEHYFQAQKFADARDQDEIRTANTPILAARMGRDRNRKLRRDWERVKVGIMREAVEAKFRQHAELSELLLQPVTPSSSSIPTTIRSGVTAAMEAAVTSSGAFSWPFVNACEPMTIREG